MAPHWFRGYVSIFSPQGFFGFSYPAVSHLYPVDYCRCCNLDRKSFMPATGAGPKETKINLMDCTCPMCVSGVEIVCSKDQPHPFAAICRRGMREEPEEGLRRRL